MFSRTSLESYSSWDVGTFQFSGNQSKQQEKETAFTAAFGPESS
jgi:hypothetical protein